MRKIAIVLYNLGGPSDQESVQPFLLNLFNDPAILSIPQPFRYMLSKWIVWKRLKEAKANYAKMGGGSPIVPETMKQVVALQEELDKFNPKHSQYKVFFFMRYWHPFVEEVIPKINQYEPDKIILLPLYPHFSTTTTGSAILAWKKAWAKLGKSAAAVDYICCYPIQSGFIKAYTNLILKKLSETNVKNFRILFSAHGLPVKVIEKGDPYQSHIEQTVQKLVEELHIDKLDYVLCYQSKVGPLKWLEPSTEAEVKRAANDKKSLVVVPIAFVSEHIETLVELDDEYHSLAKNLGVPSYHRVDTVSIHEQFIQGLTSLCTAENPERKLCTKGFSQCFMNYNIAKNMSQ